VADTYLTADELKATLDIDGSEMDADIQRALDTAARALEKACSRRGLRRFWADTAPVERLYTAGDSDLLEIHDAYDITLVESDDDGDGVYERVWDTTEYLPVPLNAALDGEPYTAIRWRPTNPASTPHRGFPVARLAAVRVTAKYGWPAVPSFAATVVGLIAARLAKRSREAPFAVIGFGVDSAAALHIAKTDPDVAGLIHDYVRDASARSIRLG